MDGKTASEDSTSNAFDLSSLFNQKDHFDVIVHLRNRTVKCHRAILAPQSSNFAAEFTRKFRSRSATLDLSGEEDHEATYAMLAWIYGFKYSQFRPRNCEQMQWHLRMHKVAHKYDVNELTLKTLNNIQDELRSASTDEYIRFLRLAYESTTTAGAQLTEVVNELLVLRLRTLVPIEAFWRILHDHPDQSRDVIQRLSDLQAMELDVCEVCGV